MSELTNGHPEYVFLSGFMHWLPGYGQYQKMRGLFAGGYKIHLSVDPAQCSAIAKAVLPHLRDMHVYHKIVPERAKYESMNLGAQKGKFVTVYSGPLMERFLDVTKRLDDVLCTNRFLPGPTPSVRLAGPGKVEQVVGLSKMLFYTTNLDFAD